MKLIIALLITTSLFGCAVSGEIIPPPKPKPELKTLLSPDNTVDWKPVNNIQPIYPRRALSRGVTGWVAVKYSILEDGTVRDSVVIDSSPERVFDRAALKAMNQRIYQYVGDHTSPKASGDEVSIIGFNIRKQ